MQTLRQILDDQYAPLRYLSDRSIVMYRSTLDRFRDFIGHEPTLDDLSDLQAAKFVRWRSTTKHDKYRLCRPASVAKDAAHIKSLWNYCARKRMLRSDGQLLEFPDFAKPPVPKPRPQAYTVEEMSALIRAAKHRRGMIDGVPACWLWMTLLRCQWETGARIGEILALRWGEVDLERRTVTYLAHTRKGRRETITRAISADLAVWLRPQVRANTALVWPWLERRKLLSLYTSLRVLAKAAGVRYLPFHSIRKSTASYIRAAGKSAKKQLGHSSEEMAETHYYDDRIVGEESALGDLPPLDLDGPAGGPGKPR
jgi:integrase